MESYIAFENHKKHMESLPIIFHYSCICKMEHFKHINWHENVELIRVLEGTGSVLYGDKTISVNKNDLIIINCNELHSFVSKGNFIYDCLIIDREYILKNGLDTSKIQFQSKIENDKYALELFDKIKETFSSSELLIDISAALFPFISYIYHSYSSPATSSENYDAIKHAITYIMENLKNELSLDSISENIGISKYHFIRKFKKITGYTPIQYINIHRCELAKSLLKGDYPIKQVAKLAGFENQSYFSKVFLSVTKKTPSEYKEG